jgi:hypothetical protein
MNPEVNLINHVIKTGDILTPLNADVGKCFSLYDKEWKWVQEHYHKYRQVPTRHEMQSEFQNFDIIETDGVMEHWIEKLKTHFARHSLSHLMTSSAARLEAEGAYTIINQLQAELSRLGRDTSLVKDIDLVANHNERLENLQERIALLASGKNIIGIPTGIKAIDDAFGGWQKGDFVVIAGWTGSLKSWLALYFAINAWLSGHRVLYISLEMSAIQIGYRFDTLMSGLSGENFTNTGLTHATAINFDRYKHWLGELTRDQHPFTVVTNEDLGDEVTQNTVLSKIEHWKPDVCILDYHGLFDDASGVTGETEKTKNLSKAFKRIAIKTGVPIIDITGVTQDKSSIGKTVPELADLAWSKQLAYDSDLTMGLYFNKQIETLEVRSLKVRRGKDFKFWLNWDVDKGLVKEQSNAMDLPDIMKVDTDAEAAEEIR